MTAAPLRCAAVLFDLDGVLVDSTECVERTWHRWAVEHNLDPARVIEAAHGRRTLETIQIVAPHLAIGTEMAALAASESTTTEGIHEVPGARELLGSLPRNAWAIVTSGVHSVASFRIQYTGLPSPLVLVCADEIEHGKPDPEGYLVAAERLGFPPNKCIVVEDTPPGIEAAHAAGMRVIAVVGTYPAGALSDAELVVSSLAELHATFTEHSGTIEIGA
ncbi:MAG TPA: HAD-IA family hydrolase [Gemmatimonadaceae bacterium]